MKDSKNFNWGFMSDNVKDVLGDDFWGDLGKIIPRQGPNVDMYKTDKKLVVVMDLPGVSPSDNISIKLKGLKLIISGRIPYTYPVSQNLLTKKERFTGDFSREIQLPTDIVPNEVIQAYLKNGVLEIHIPISSSDDDKEIFVDFQE